MTDGPPTYWDYLRLDRLLDLQGGLEGDESQLMPDELHFILVHQVFELWFKLVLRQIREARDHLAAPHVPEEHVPYVVHHLRRVNTIFELAIDQFKVMETLTPQDFLDFRDKLLPASGFQSFQLREMELLLGLDRGQRAKSGFGDPIAAIEQATGEGAKLAQARLAAARDEGDFRSALHVWLGRTPIQGSTPNDPDDAENVDRFIDAYLAAVERHGEEQSERFVSRGALTESGAAGRKDKAFAEAKAFLRAEDVAEDERASTRRVRAALLFIESYRELPLLAWPRVLLDTVVEFEELMVLWRSRHARMVERLIGRRTGTGGSAGVDYLDKTAKYRSFKELWAVRTLLLPRAAVPALERPEVYGFAG